MEAISPSLPLSKTLVECGFPIPTIQNLFCIRGPKGNTSTTGHSMGSTEPKKLLPPLGHLGFLMLIDWWAKKGITILAVITHSDYH